MPRTQPWTTFTNVYVVYGPDVAFDEYGVLDPTETSGRRSGNEKVKEIHSRMCIVISKYINFEINVLVLEYVFEIDIGQYH